MRRWLPLVVQVLAEALTAVGLAVVLAVGWAAFGELGFVAALGRTAFLAAGLWLFAGSSLFPRMTALPSLQWGLGTSEDLVEGEPVPPPVELTPLGSALVVAALLLVLGTLLGS